MYCFHKHIKYFYLFRNSFNCVSTPKHEIQNRLLSLIHLLNLCCIRIIIFTLKTLQKKLKKYDLLRCVLVVLLGIAECGCGTIRSKVDFNPASQRQV